jgi:hypothetical protein
MSRDIYFAAKGGFNLKFKRFGRKGTKNNRARNLAFGALTYLYDRLQAHEKGTLVYHFLIICDLVPR